MQQQFSRRERLAATGLAAGLYAVPSSTAIAGPRKRTESEPFGYCLNMSTIRGQKLGFAAQIELAAKAGYDGIEPWIGEIDQYVKDGGSLKDAGKRIADLGLTVESAIGFARWIVDDDDERKKGLEEAKRNMDMLRTLGGKRVAAPPVGAHRGPIIDLFKAADRYRALLEVGDETGVVPQVEVWGFSSTLSRLGEAIFVAVESGHPQACLLPDVYHIFKGGSEFTGLKLLGASAIHVFHVNDYPADPPRKTIGDEHRVHPGDGVAPLNDILRTMRDNGFRGALSLELFNRDYWKQDALEVAKTGLEKTRAAVQRALG